MTQSILDIAVSEAEKHKAPRVLAITIKLGEFSGVVPQLIQEYFNLISKGTVADSAKLIIEKVPVRIRCEACGKENVIDRAKVKCPDCGSIDIQMRSGREFYVESLEVSDED